MAETWVLNQSVTLPSSSSTYINVEINFTSNGTTFVYFRISRSTIYYCTSTELFSGYVTVYDQTNGWTNEAYRTVVFDTAPTGDLLTWLQANGTKQAEPEPTVHKNACLIDGTGYSIKRGKAFIDGTSYTIENGRTLIDGVGYNISLAKKLSVDIQGTFAYTTVSIDGVSYTDAGVVKAEPNTQVTVTVSGSPAAITNSAVYYNGSKVATGSKNGREVIPATYSFTLKSDTTIKCTDYGGGRTGYAIATITT